MAIGVIGNDKKNKLLNINNINKYYDNSFHVDLNDNNESHAIIVNNIKDKSVVLDVGCAQGLIGEALKKYKNCEVDGIELDSKAIEYAKKANNYNKLYSFDITDVSNKEYKSFFKKNKKYDYILFPDVLEHLLYPIEVLFEFGKLLKDDGNMIISLPNIAHYDIIDGLLNEKFNYSQMGILDNTHLRFFTKYSFLEYLDEKNKLKENSFAFELEKIDHVLIEPSNYGQYSEFKKMLSNNKNLIALQNIFVLSKCNKEKVTNNLQKIISEKHVNITEIINNNLIEKTNLEKKLNDLWLEKNKANGLYMEALNSMSWKLTKPFRIFENKINDIKEFVKEKANNKINVLYFVQRWLDLTDINNKTIGGTTLHVLDLINNMQDYINPYVVTIINNNYYLVYIRNNKQFLYNLGISAYVFQFDAYHYDFLKMMEKIIDELQIDLLHIHHFINFPCDLQLLTKKYRTIVTLHDYTSICPTYFLIDTDKQYCKYACSNKCLNCCKIINIDVRKEAMGILLSNSKVIVPDESVIQEIQKYYNINDYEIIPNGIDINGFKKFEINDTKNKDKIKKIAFIGDINDHKGSEIYKKMINKNEKNFIYYLFGDSEDLFFKNNRLNYNYMGKYDKSELPKLLNDNKIDLVLMFSICPESFSYVLSETMIAKIPVISLNVGAIANRINKTNIGKVIDYHNNYDNIIKEIKDMFKTENYEKYLKNLDKVKIPDINQMCNSIMKIYNINMYKHLGKNYFKKKNFLNKFDLIKII